MERNGCVGVCEGSADREREQREREQGADLGARGFPPTAFALSIRP